MLFAQSVSAHEFVATLTDILDGDTLSAVIHDENIKIRLLDVDCYETTKNKRARFQHEYYGLSYDEIIENGNKSKEKLKKLLKDHRYIRVKWKSRDSFGRILGHVYLDDIKSAGITDVNQYMLKTANCNKYMPKKLKKTAAKIGKMPVKHIIPQK